MKNELLRLIAAVILGLILGATGMNAYISKEFESMSAKNKELERQLKDVSDDLVGLSLRLEQQQREKLIGDIKASVSMAKEYDHLPSFEKTSVKLDGEKEIKDLLSSLRGQENKNINHNMIPQIINGREFESEGRRYVLQVNIVVVTDEINVYAEAKLVKQLKQ